MDVIKEYVMRYENEVLQLLPDKMQELIRCKDCKFQVDSGRRFPECDMHFLIAKDGWFCADGKRKDGELEMLQMDKAQAVKLSDSEGACDPVNSPSHYVGKIECIDYLRDKLTQEEFTGFCMGNVLKYSSRWRKKDGLQDLKKAKVYLDWAIENEEKGS